MWIFPTFYDFPGMWKCSSFPVCVRSFPLDGALLTSRTGKRAFVVHVEEGGRENEEENWLLLLNRLHVKWKIPLNCFSSHFLLYFPFFVKIKCSFSSWIFFSFFFCIMLQTTTRLHDKINKLFFLKHLIKILLLLSCRHINFTVKKNLSMQSLFWHGNSHMFVYVV